ncbi:LAME_0B02982g1_1 [Lachancea meyersii CBS 8951]|uniref:LAME_0B02982g1_1 n=1 Tax=Lachancea meyersii CBS 8951 TaxID=1266667 RepID=A0A1G4IU15_9SACH|nr:LAME_0B02982g1_1 [Lachancea meyersii CBS 8951]
MRDVNRPLLSSHALKRVRTYDTSLSDGALANQANPDSNVPGAQSPRPSRSSIEIIDPPKERTTVLSDLSGIQQSLTVWDCLTYYLPCFSWLPSYSSSKLFRDLLAGASLASFQIPLAMSYSTSVAHVPPICGLNALAVTPFVYAIFGSVPQMIVGPESAISLVVGQAIEKLAKHEPKINLINLCVILTFSSGAILLLFGLLRFGFLDGVLSRALLRGFISAVGIVMVLNSLLAELKLKKVFEDAPSHYHAPYEKIKFLIKYAPANAHLPTATLSLITFGILMVIKYLKKGLSKRYKKVIFIPEILLVVTVVTVVSYIHDFKHLYGIEIVGDINTESTGHLRNPLAKKNLSYYNDLFHASFMVALLGFFESTTASKSLGTAYDLAISSNRELVALGSLNLVGSFFGALPSFGGYGRSKINAYSGAATVMSGVFMGAITFVTSKFLLGMIHYIPVCILSVITTVVGISLFEEAPADIRFHYRCRGYNELITFAITVLTTFFYSVEAGITVGCGYSIIRTIKQSTLSRIQILARISGTNRFVNADLFDDLAYQDELGVCQLEHVEGCLIVKIPEPLIFTNTEDLKSRLNRLENYGSVTAHPASPRVRDKTQTRHMILDLNGMTDLDSSAAQILCEIVTNLKKRRVRVYLSRVSLNAAVRDKLTSSGIAGMVETTTPSEGVTPSSASIPVWYFQSIQDALRCADEIDSFPPSRESSECASLNGTFVQCTAIY